MEQRKIERFRKRVILIHWLQAAAFTTLMITGAIMLFNLTDINGGRQIRIIHQVAAAWFVIVPVLFTIFDPQAAMNFLKIAFTWDNDARAWLRQSVGFYFGRKVTMSPQGYLNGDQKLWQLVVIITGLTFMVTGVLLWFFKFKIPLALYQWVLLTHVFAFVVFTTLFLVHLYLTTIHPAFMESLSAMVDGKISESYARNRHGKWYDEKTGSK